VPAATRSSSDGNGPVSIAGFQEALRKPSPTAIDVREPDEYAYEHIDGTLNIPESLLAASMDRLPRDRDVYVTCATGIRSAQAVGRLRSVGFPAVHNVEGGIAAWKKEGLPVVRRKGPIPIMRQVQIIAGSLALIGGAFPPLRWIAVLIGAGLVLAGASGFCGMARLLALLPWNKAPSGPAQESSCSGGCSQN
jgi:rhodanese-related sulfurtransferase